MVGKGVLLECLDSTKVEEVLVINRSSLNMQHPKLKEVLLKDFLQVATIADQLQGYDACFYCMGISALGLSEEQYTKIIYDTTVAFADVLHAANPQMVFNFVSGAGTDSNEKGRVMWARVKGKAENYILNKGFKDAYAFRPGGILPERGIKSRTSWYNTFYVVLKPFFPLMKKLKSITTTTRIGHAMINVVGQPSTLKHLEGKDINVVAAS